MHDPIEEVIEIYQLEWKKFSALPLKKKVRKVVITIIIRIIYVIIGTVVGFIADFMGIRLGGALGSGKSTELAFDEISYIMEIGVAICAIFFVIYGDIIIGHFFKVIKKKF